LLDFTCGGLLDRGILCLPNHFYPVSIGLRKPFYGPELIFLQRWGLRSCWSDVIWYCLPCLHQVLFDEVVAGPNAGFMEQAYQGRKNVYFLEHLGLTHNFDHMAAALVIRGLLGMRRC